MQFQEFAQGPGTKAVPALEFYKDSFLTILWGFFLSGFVGILR